MIQFDVSTLKLFYFFMLSFEFKVGEISGNPEFPLPERWMNEWKVHTLGDQRSFWYYELPRDRTIDIAALTTEAWDRGSPLRVFGPFFYFKQFPPKSSKLVIRI